MIWALKVYCRVWCFNASFAWVWSDWQFQFYTTAVDNGNNSKQPVNDENDYDAVQQQTSDYDEVDEAQGEEGTTSEPVQRPKLPSFKRRQRENDEETGEKIDLSEEIRLQKQKRARTEEDGETEEQGEVDPQQGTNESFLSFAVAVCPTLSSLLTAHYQLCGTSWTGSLHLRSHLESERRRKSMNMYVGLLMHWAQYCPVW